MGGNPSVKGYFFAERQPGFTFSSICWHAAGHEETVLQFVDGFYLASDMAYQMNLRKYAF